jgi:hypothetical protein
MRTKEAREMKKMLAAVALVTVGLGIGMGIGAGTAHAQLFKMFRTNPSTATMTDLETYAYIEGAYDMLATVSQPYTNLAANVDHTTALGWIQHQAACLDAKGENVGEITAWARYRWMLAKQFSQDSAAETLLLDACK